MSCIMTKKKKKDLKKCILCPNIVCEKIGKKPSTSLLWLVSGQSSGNRKEGVVQRNCRGRIAELGSVRDAWWMTYQRLNSPWLRNVLSSPSPHTDATWRKDQHSIVISFYFIKSTDVWLPWRSAFLMLYRARKTKGTSWLDFVFVLLK